MLRVLLVIVAAVFMIFVAAAVARTLFWLALIVLIAVAAGVAFGAVRFGRRSARHNPRYRR
jgi:positive regulator of sigma E activity